MITSHRTYGGYIPRGRQDEKKIDIIQKAALNNIQCSHDESWFPCRRTLIHGRDEGSFHTKRQLCKQEQTKIVHIQRKKGHKWPRSRMTNKHAYISAACISNDLRKQIQTMQSDQNARHH